MSGTSTNTGNQVVSLYPGQGLATAFGSAVLNDVIPPGINNCQVTLTDNGTTFFANISAGTTFVFRRNTVDPVFTSWTSSPVIGKITLGSAYSLSISKSAFWSTTSYDTLYLVADWSFDANNPYVNITCQTDTSIMAMKALDGSATHVLVICALLNNKYFSTNWGVSGTGQSLSNYHIAYDYIPNQDILLDTTKARNSLNVFFDSYGAGLYVGSGIVQIGGKTSAYSSSFYSGLAYPTRGKLTGFGTGITAPASKLQFYTSSATTNAKIDVVAISTQSSYYQIDFLRYVINSQTHTGSVVWQSFLKPSGSLNFTSDTKGQVISYLATQNFELSDHGITLAIVVRYRLALDTANLIWPEWTIIPKYDLDSIINGGAISTRTKLPIYRSSDLGY